MRRQRDEPLLSSPSRRNAYPCNGVLSVTLLSLVIGAAAAFLLLAAPTAPINLCASSPGQATCQAIVADAVLASSPRGDDAHPSRRRPAQVLRAILATSLDRHDATAEAVAGMLRRRAALEDCVQLMGLARDRLADGAAAAAAAPDDARTWLSAVLTDHVTCLDGLDDHEPLRDAVGAHLQPLKSLASASLAVLAAAAAGADRDDVLAEVAVDGFPSWVPARDRALLEAGAVKADVVVAKDGSGEYETVKEAVDAAPDGGTSRYVIYVKEGVYEENLEVGKKKRELSIIGDGMDQTVITGSLNVVDGATTFNSSTLALSGDGIILQDLKVENTAGPEKEQAVALRISADRAVINRCRLDGYQDTLYAHQLRQFYRDSLVSGTVDFVFGNAAAVLQGCVLAARRPLHGQQNAVTAQGRTDPGQNTGTSIHRCRIIPVPDLMPVARQVPTFLGRPWQEYSRTVYMMSYLDAHVDPRGWLEWKGDFALRTLFYGEYQNQGPGAATAGRVITDRSVAMRFTVGQFIIQGGDWLNATGVTYDEGL